MNDLRHSVMVIIVFRHIVSIFRNSRKSIAHDSSHMGRFQHFHIVLCISGGYRILNRDSQIIAEPSNRKSLGYSLWYDFLITVIREKAVYFSCILQRSLLFENKYFSLLFCRCDRRSVYTDPPAQHLPHILQPCRALIDHLHICEVLPYPWRKNMCI